MAKGREFSIRDYAILSLILAAAATRLVPHAPNFTAIGAVALFGGVYLNRRWAAFAIPAAAMLLGDLGLALLGGKFTYAWSSYLLFAATPLLGVAMRSERLARVPMVVRLTTASVVAAVLFFVVSNFHVWAAGNGRMYPHTAEGLLACYVAAIPFALNMLAGNLVYGGVLFAAWHLVRSRVPSVAQAPGLLTA